MKEKIPEQSVYWQSLASQIQTIILMIAVPMTGAQTITGMDFEVNNSLRIVRTVTE